MVTSQQPTSSLHNRSDRHADWILEMDVTGLEVLRTPWNALVLVDRAPLEHLACAGGLDRKGLHGLDGSQLTLVGDVSWVDEDVMHGVHSGMVGGTAVLVDQYVRCLAGVAQTVVRVITPAKGAQAESKDLDRFVLDLMRES